MNSSNRSGQILIIALGILLFLAIALPSIIQLTQYESRWTLKEQRTTRAYQLAESAVEHGFQNLLLSTSTWYDIQALTPIVGFQFDRTYTGVSGGEYQINYTQGPGTQQATITGVGRSTTADGTKELRAIKAVYSNASGATNAITAGNTVTVGANVNVEWGAVISYTSIDPGGRTHPRFYTSGSITGIDTNPAAPNTDNVQWWSYKTDLPPQPQVDLQFYKNKALNNCTPQLGCPPCYNAPGSGINTDITGCVDTLGTNTYYFETGDWTWKNPGANFIYGNVVLASGNMAISGNGGTDSSGPGVYMATIPPQAWQEYGKTVNDWNNFYHCMDGGSPATYAAAVTASYVASAVTTQIPSGCVNSAGSVLVHGFVYAGGGTGLNGGGNARFHGVVMTPNTVTVHDLL